MARANTKLGDVFLVKINDAEKKYMQYIISDMTQLNSDVIRAFKKVYPIDTPSDLEEIGKDDVEFYAHCVTEWGIQFGFWEKVGNIKEVGKTDHILFRDSGDYGNPESIVYRMRIGEYDFRAYPSYGSLYQTKKILKLF